MAELTCKYPDTSQRIANMTPKDIFIKWKEKKENTPGCWSLSWGGGWVGGVLIQFWTRVTQREKRVRLRIQLRLRCLSKLRALLFMIGLLAFGRLFPSGLGQNCGRAASSYRRAACRCGCTASCRYCLVVLSFPWTLGDHECQWGRAKVWPGRLHLGRLRKPSSPWDGDCTALLVVTIHLLASFVRAIAHEGLKGVPPLLVLQKHR